MIEPTKADIGRLVIYRGQDREEGRITSFNDQYVFVRYGRASNGVATSRKDLEWAYA